MLTDLPSDNATRRELAPLMSLISKASQIRNFNRALGTHLESLDHLPSDYVAAVIAWADVLAEKGLL